MIILEIYFRDDPSSRIQSQCILAKRRDKGTSNEISLSADILSFRAIKGNWRVYGGQASVASFFM